MSMLLKGVGSSSAPFVGALDDFEASLQHIYAPSWRLLTSYTGPLVRVRRSSDDVESDINAGPTGYIDESAFAAFVGASTAYVTKIYNQLGAVNVSNVNPSEQPQFSTSVAAWGNKAAMVFDGTDDVLSTESSIAPASLLIGGKFNAAPSGLGRLVVAFPSGNSSIFSFDTISAYGRFGSVTGEQSEAVSSTEGLAAELWYNGASSIVSLTTEQAAAADTALDNSVYNLGAYNSSTQQTSGSVAYFITLNAFLSAPNRAAIRAALAAKYPV